MTWRERLAEGRVILLDGGTGSELRRRGVALSPVCWSAAANLNQAERLQAIHRDYIRAGADIVTANTFATTRFVLAAAGLADRFVEINRAAVAAARAAVEQTGGRAIVAAALSCLPPGMDPEAYPPPDAEYGAYAELAECLAAAGVELILLEMLQHAAHAERACRAAAAVGLPFLAGLSCRRAEGPGTAAAPPLVAYDDAAAGFDDVLAAVLAFSPDAVGIMHSPLDAMRPALDRLRRSWTGPIAAYAELPYAADPAAAAGSAASAPGPAAYAAAAQDWIVRGAGIVGGCCGTGPAHIAALRRMLDARTHTRSGAGTQ